MPSRRELANAIRALSMDAVQQANSGHPGAPMGMADITEVLWNDFLHHNPANPQWANRDRFVLSNGHGSMLIYSLLHLSGYDLGIDDLRNFRQLHSRTAGHPEYGETPGVETTTGPLGQGITNAVGMAMAEQVLAGQFNRDGHKIVDHYTYAFLGDGCLMEGISHESCSLAGTLGLGKLIAVWDDNGISIDGHVEGWFTDDTPARFEAYGWHVVRDVDGHDADSIARAMHEAKSVNDKPTLICARTVIGFGAPNLCGSHDCHGAPLGADEIAAARENLGWNHGPFEVPDAIYAGWNARNSGADAESAWDVRFAAYRAAFPELAAEFERRMAGDLPADWAATSAAEISAVDAEAAKVATRKASQLALERFGPSLPEFFGGSADLTGSNLTAWSGSKVFGTNAQDGNYLSFGVREFGMAAIANGMALHGGLLPYIGTFLVFSDYSRNAIRMAALMGLRVIHVLTHDSIGLGEDGPTHQPVEHVPSLRMIPGVDVWRPCDAVETAVAWQQSALRVDGPSCLALTRQGVPHQPRDATQLADVARGGYVLRDCDGTPEVILIATGSEVELAVAAADTMSDRRVRVVSMPCCERFDAQDAAYRESVLPAAVTARVAVEAAITAGWYRYVGTTGAVVGIDSFGASAPAGELYKLFNITAQRVVEEAQSLLG